VSINADAADVKTGYRSSANAREQYFWWIQKMLASAHLSSAVAGINCDGGHSGAVMVAAISVCSNYTIQRRVCAETLSDLSDQEPADDIGDVTTDAVYSNLASLLTALQSARPSGHAFDSYMVNNICVYYSLLLLLLYPFNGLFSRTTWVSWYQKGETSLDLNEARDDGVMGCSGKQFTPRSRQITTLTPHHSIFTGQMLFPANSVKALKAKCTTQLSDICI